MNLPKKLPTIIFNGKRLDNTKEHELIADNEFGFIVDIVYRRDHNRPIYLHDHEHFQRKQNITEVHYLYTIGRPINKSSRHKVAIESDIHSTGGTKEIEGIDTLHIYQAEIMYNHICPQDMI